MKTIAYCPVHYGRDFLAYALRSVYPCVDEIHILYTAQPSYGTRSGAPCPDSRESLLWEAEKGAREKLRWTEGDWTQEGPHRDTILAIAQQVGADLIVGVDADEVGDTPSLAKAIPIAMEQPQRNLRVPFIHFWRSFSWVCRDECQAVRFIVPGNPVNTDGYVPLEKPIYHFGYARSVSDVAYKWSCHGHQAELRKGADLPPGYSSWIELYERWQPGVDNVHPTCSWKSDGSAWWTPTPYPKEELPEMLREHPYYSMEIIP